MPTKKATKKTVVKRAVRTKPAEVGVYEYEIVMNDQILEGRTNDIKALLLTLMPEKLNSKVVLRFSANGLATVQVLNIPSAKLLFTNALRASLFEKRVEMALDTHNG
jgi:hypothetical protein